MNKFDIKEQAYNAAYNGFFCNVGLDDWPNDPQEFMHKLDDEGLDFCFDIDGKMMQVSELYENWPVKEVIREIHDRAKCIIEMCNKVKEEGRI